MVYFFFKYIYYGRLSRGVGNAAPDIFLNLYFKHYCLDLFAKIMSGVSQCEVEYVSKSIKNLYLAQSSSEPSSLIALVKFRSVDKNTNITWFYGRV